MAIVFFHLPIEECAGVVEVALCAKMFFLKSYYSCLHASSKKGLKHILTNVLPYQLQANRRMCQYLVESSKIQQQFHGRNQHWLTGLLWTTPLSTGGLNHLRGSFTSTLDEGSQPRSQWRENASTYSRYTFLLPEKTATVSVDSGCLYYSQIAS